MRVSVEDMLHFREELSQRRKDLIHSCEDILRYRAEKEQAIEKILHDRDDILRIFEGKPPRTRGKWLLIQALEGK